MEGFFDPTNNLWNYLPMRLEYCNRLVSISDVGAGSLKAFYLLEHHA